MATDFALGQNQDPGACYGAVEVFQMSFTLENKRVCILFVGQSSANYLLLQTVSVLLCIVSTLNALVFFRSQSMGTQKTQRAWHGMML